MRAKGQHLSWQLPGNRCMRLWQREMSTVLGALEDAERRHSALGEAAMDGGFR